MAAVLCWCSIYSGQLSNCRCCHYLLCSIHDGTRPHWASHLQVSVKRGTISRKGEPLTTSHRWRRAAVRLNCWTAPLILCTKYIHWLLIAQGCINFVVNDYPLLNTSLLHLTYWHLMRFCGTRNFSHGYRMQDVMTENPPKTFCIAIRDIPASSSPCFRVLLELSVRTHCASLTRCLGSV